MTSPWHITATAVREYLRLADEVGSEGGPGWQRAESALAAWAERVSASQEPPTRAGLRTYRMGRPHRLRLVVSVAPHQSGLPQLVSVLPETEALPLWLQDLRDVRQRRGVGPGCRGRLGRAPTVTIAPPAQEPPALGHGGRRHGLVDEGATAPLPIRLTQPQRAWLTEVAKDGGIPIAEIVRGLIDDAMEDE